MISLRRLQPNAHGAFPVAAAKRIVKQTPLALDYLYRECGPRTHRCDNTPIGV
ncbi:hypothetical protein DFH29DRAFT_955336, partial [Suillus ampliporus]